MMIHPLMMEKQIQEDFMIERFEHLQVVSTQLSVELSMNCIDEAIKSIILKSRSKTKSKLSNVRNFKTQKSSGNGNASIHNTNFTMDLIEKSLTASDVTNKNKGASKASLLHVQLIVISHQFVQSIIRLAITNASYTISKKLQQNSVIRNDRSRMGVRLMKQWDNPLDKQDELIKKILEELERHANTSFNVLENDLLPNPYVRNYHHTMFYDSIRQVNPQFQSFQHIQQLDLNNLLIGDDKLEMLTKQIIKCPLRILNLGGNNISDEGCHHLSKVLRSFPYLIHLNLARNYFTDHGIEKLFHADTYSPSLELIDISYNALTAKSAYLLSLMITDIERICHLQTLILGGKLGQKNNWGNTFLQTLLASLILSRNRTICKISVPDFNISSVGVDILSALVCYSSTITSLNCTQNAIRNRFDPMSFSMFFGAVHCNRVLTELTVRQCGLTRTELSRISQHIDRNAKMTSRMKLFITPSIPKGYGPAMELSHLPPLLPAFSEETVRHIEPTPSHSSGNSLHSHPFFVPSIIPSIPQHHESNPHPIPRHPLQSTAAVTSSHDMTTQLSYFAWSDQVQLARRVTNSINQSLHAYRQCRGEVTNQWKDLTFPIWTPNHPSSNTLETAFHFQHRVDTQHMPRLLKNLFKVLNNQMQSTELIQEAADICTKLTVDMGQFEMLRSIYYIHIVSNLDEIESHIQSLHQLIEHQYERVQSAKQTFFDQLLQFYQQSHTMIHYRHYLPSHLVPGAVVSDDLIKKSGKMVSWSAPPTPTGKTSLPHPDLDRQSVKTYRPMTSPALEDTTMTYDNAISRLNTMSSDYQQFWQPLSRSHETHPIQVNPSSPSTTRNRPTRQEKEIEKVLFENLLMSNEEVHSQFIELSQHLEMVLAFSYKKRLLVDYLTHDNLNNSGSDKHSMSASIPNTPNLLQQSSSFHRPLVHQSSRISMASSLQRSHSVLAPLPVHPLGAVRPLHSSQIPPIDFEEFIEHHVPTYHRIGLASLYTHYLYLVFPVERHQQAHISASQNEDMIHKIMAKMADVAASHQLDPVPSNGMATVGRHGVASKPKPKTIRRKKGYFQAKRMAELIEKKQQQQAIDEENAKNEEARRKNPRIGLLNPLNWMTSS